MPNFLDKNLWLIGAGPMAVDYVKVLQAQEIPFEVIGRGEKSAAVFKEKTGVDVHLGGLEACLERLELPGSAIVAVSVEELANTTISLLDRGVKRILVEKPAGLNADEIEQVARKAQESQAEVYVAYNRRFYGSTLKAQDIINEDGGIISFNFEFTEWSHEIKDLPKAPQVKEEWFLANSSHVVDLAFYIGGVPKELTCHTAGGLSWHPVASIFVGTGLTDKGALFSYQANWEAPGRWSVEFLTRKHRLIFRPMEQLQIQEIGSVAINPVELNNDLDKEFKPGLYKQVFSFLNDDQGRLNLPKINDHYDFTRKVLVPIVTGQK